MRKKICYVASSGGHLEEILGLEGMDKEYPSLLITEKTKYKPPYWQQNVYYMPQVNRREKLCMLWLAVIFFKSLFLLLRENPDVIITTGALMSIPVCIVARLYGKKVIYIESIARVKTRSATGAFFYKYKVANLFILQWDTLKALYPNAVFGGKLI